MPARLHIGIDSEKVVVAPVPLKMRTGRARRYRAGSVTEVVPVPPSGRSRADRARSIFQLALVLAVLSGVLNAAGIAWWAPVAASVAMLASVGWEQSRAARAGFRRAGPTARRTVTGTTSPTGRAPPSVGGNPPLSPHRSPAVRCA